MRDDHPEICLVQPEIPQNTGNIGRLVAAVQGRLHLVEPLGFELSQKQVRRAGLDYWPFLDFMVHPDFAAFSAAVQGPLAFLSTKGQKLYTDIPTDAGALVFGCETKGLPESIWSSYPQESFYKLPMPSPNVRSLNLANAVAIVVYDWMRRKGLFADSERDEGQNV